MTSCRSHVDGCWFSSDLFGVRVSVNEGVGAGSRSPPPIINVNYHAHISPEQLLPPCVRYTSLLRIFFVTRLNQIAAKTLNRSTT